MAAVITSLSLISRFVLTAFPLVKNELNGWHLQAAACPEKELALQAVASITDKAFHCKGGSIYSLYPGTDQASLVRFITALQTISDYLDNLCDRAGVYDEAAFQQLHIAMTDALEPQRPSADYYAYYPLQADGGYLVSLAAACREQVLLLPSYSVVKADALELVMLYSQLQTYKHLDPAVREEKMLAWIEPCLTKYPDITPWEFAAATGSTLGIFMLCAAASAPSLTPQQAAQIRNCYFPYITGLHILLDYFIDAAEDRLHGDLNFIAYYGSAAMTRDRLAWFTRAAFAAASQLPEPEFHRTVVSGLLAMYLSDPKTNREPEKSIKKDLLRQAGQYTQFLYIVCKGLRMMKIL